MECAGLIRRWCDTWFDWLPRKRRRNSLPFQRNEHALVKRLVADHSGSPSKTLISIAGELTGLSQYPALDAGCGFGRNAFALASRGLSVVCVDHNRSRLSSLMHFAAMDLKKLEYQSGRLYPVLADLKRSQWPFSQNCFGAIICVHFLETDLFGAFRDSLVPRGYLYIETFGGHGRNYLDLPKAGEIRDLLSRHFHFAFYRERAVGPPGSRAVSVKLLGKKL
jgi:SAM-dependent methyltransferase